MSTALLPRDTGSGSVASATQYRICSSGWLVRTPRCRLVSSTTNDSATEKLTELYLQLLIMTTAVKIDEETKSVLEELQAEIKLKTGTKVTQQELLAQLVASAVESRTEFIDSFRDGSPALSDAEIAAFNEGQISSGVETTEDDIDDILYR